jgi:hypothetical protein
MIMNVFNFLIAIVILSISSDLMASSKVVICSSQDSVAGSLKDSIVNRHQMASRKRTRKGFYTRLFQVEFKQLMGATYQMSTTSLTAFCHKGEQCMGPHQVESREVNLEEDGDVIRHQKNEDTVDVYINQRTLKCVVKSYNFRINPHLRNFSGDIR